MHITAMALVRARHNLQSAICNCTRGLYLVLEQTQCSNASTLTMLAMLLDSKRIIGAASQSTYLIFHLCLAAHSYTLALAEKYALLHRFRITQALAEAWLN
jgi:hypothetical protein